MTPETLVSYFQSSPLMLVVAGVFLVNLAITVFEVVLDLTTKKERRWKDSAANCVIFIASQLLEKTAFGALGIVALLPIYYFIPYEIPMTWWTWALALFAADFTYYWMHRTEHERRILWASHSVHHSSQDYNLTVGFRLCLIEGLFEWIFLIPMILVGFNPFQAIIGLVFVAQYQHWIHTEHISKMGWLDKVFNTPSVHRVHHGSNPIYLDKNFGGILMIWDRIFGTFQSEDIPVKYGLTTNIDTNNPIKINTVEFQNLWQELKNEKGMLGKLRLCFSSIELNK